MSAEPVSDHLQLTENPIPTLGISWMTSRKKAKMHPPTIHAALTEIRCQSEAVLEHADEGDDVIVGMFNLHRGVAVSHRAGPASLTT
jgi:hypothetical protein